jgi:integrase
MTFSNAMENYLTAKLSEFRNEKHRKQWRSTLDTYAVPKLGALSVSEISVQDVLRVLQPIWSEKTETAKRLRGRIEAVLSWATVAGYRKGDNPARWKGNLSETLPKPAKIAQKENRPALSLDDLTRWWGDLSEREGMAARALQFLTLTAARSGEVRGLTWDELNLSLKASNGARVGVWTVPAARMKNKRQHTVPLSPEAVALLDTLPRMEGSPYVFFAQRGGMLSDMTISAVMRRIHAADLKAGRTGYLDRDSQRPAVPHGLRSTFRQWAAKQGYPRDMAEMALAHWIGSEVERAYQRHDMLDRRREMMQAWAAEVAGMKDDSVRNSKVSVLFN